jgi:hypothetical protein
LTAEHEKTCETIAKMKEKVLEIAEQVAEHKKQEERAVMEMRARGKEKPKSLAFEHQVRTVLASGCSARAAVEQVLSSARVYLSPAVFADYEKLVPNLRW